MFRVTTPTHKFIFTEPVSDCSAMKVTYAQDGYIVLEKSKSDFTFDTEEIDGETMYTATVKLTQAETKRFNVQTIDRYEVGNSVQCQIRILYSDGTALASDIVKIKLNDVLNEEILT